MTHDCQHCAHRGVRTPATTGYVDGFSGEKTHTCASCYSDHLAFEKHMAGPGGPYKGEVGSKGGGASADMASYWNGKAGVIRRKVYDYLRSNPPAGAEDIARAINEHPDNVSPRLSELTKARYGHLLAKGPRTARTRMGSLAHVYQINQEAA